MRLATCEPCGRAYLFEEEEGARESTRCPGCGRLLTLDAVLSPADLPPLPLQLPEDVPHVRRAGTRKL